LVHGRAKASHEDASSGGFVVRIRLGSGGASDGGAMTRLGRPGDSGLGSSAAATGRYWSPPSPSGSLKSPARYVRASTRPTGTSPSGAAKVLTDARRLTGV
jgi:hypothetical protein